MCTFLCVEELRQVAVVKGGGGREVLVVVAKEIFDRIIYLGKEEELYLSGNRSSKFVRNLSSRSKTVN
jgi:hypothetical protein